MLAVSLSFLSSSIDYCNIMKSGFITSDNIVTQNFHTAKSSYGPLFEGFFSLLFGSLEILNEYPCYKP